MEKKMMAWKTKGMNRDLSVSAFNPEFAYENMNLRLATNEGNTMMSWVNEKGTKKVTFIIDVIPWASEEVQGKYQEIIQGIPIGTAIVNHTLVLFTVSNDPSDAVSYIYTFSLDPTGIVPSTTKRTLYGRMLYHGNLNFSSLHPIETLASYESEDVQKVYWTDGLNQPRMINIAKPVTYGLYNDTSFDFINELKLEEDVIVLKEVGGNGSFPAGVIQYAFTYYNKFGQESNIFYTTPLLYVSPKDRGAAPDEMVDNVFKITIENVDKNFDYLRIYSIQRTSLNGTPICKRVQDINIKESAETTFVYTDTGRNGNTVDPTELLYKGGEEIVAQTLEQKDNTLFLGNLKIARPGMYEFEGKSRITINKRQREIYVEGISGDYSYSNQLTAYKNDNMEESTSCAGFKTGNTYRLGVQFQYKTGKWSDPIHLKDLPVTEKPKVNGSYLYLNAFLGEIPEDIVKNLIDAGYRRVRAVMAVPNPQDRKVVCQGVVNPTLYTENNRHNSKILYSQASWFFRARNHNTGDEGVNITAIKKMMQNIGTTSALITGITFVDLNDSQKTYPVNNGSYNINYYFAGGSQYYATTIEYNGASVTVKVTGWHDEEFSADYNGTLKVFDEVSGDGTVAPNYQIGLSYTKRNVKTGVPDTNPGDVGTPQFIRAVEIEGDYKRDNQYKIDWNFVTMHSPDIVFDDQYFNVDYSGTSFKKIGNVFFEKTLSSIDIQTETPAIAGNAGGFKPQTFVGNNVHGIVSGLFYEDGTVEDTDDGKIRRLQDGNKIEPSPNMWLTYPWQGSGSINNDVNRPADKGVSSTVLKKKVISNLRYSNETLWDTGTATDTEYAFAVPPQVFHSNEASILKFNIGNSSGVYQGNIDTLLYPDNYEGKYFAFEDTNGDIMEEEAVTPFNSVSWWKTFNTLGNDAGEVGTPGLYKWKSASNMWERGSGESEHIGNEVRELVMKKNPVRVKYKSTPHLIFGVSNLPFSPAPDGSSLPVVEIVRPVTNPYGGDSKDVLKENVWIPCGKSKYLKEGETCEFKYNYGDAYYQRWDCLKTYAFTPEDANQVVEIGSFMLESYTNIDGRYDRNRGQINNLNMSPLNFNLLNPVYSQLNNFFQYKILDADDYKRREYPNQITWTKTKEAGADVDLWTNITLASILELDGDKGAISKLTRLNDSLLCFQDTGIAQVLYNERAQLSTADGVPVELANSGKVDGKRYISNTIGCSNKWSMTTTPLGIYFMDSHDKSIYLFNGQLENLSLKGGMNSWCKQSIPACDVHWNPDGFENFVTYYDKKNQDVLFINNDKALAYSEKFGAFTSFYDYGSAPYLCQINDRSFWLMHSRDSKDASGRYYIWEHQEGDYCKFFDLNKPYWMTLVGNPDPLLDKTFTNMEFRACVEGEGPNRENESDGLFEFYLPFDNLEVWDEYQHGIAKLQQKNGSGGMQHHMNDNPATAALKRKFRIWRCDIPRDNAPVPDDMGLPRVKARPLDRMRNPWVYLKLMKNVESEEVNGETIYHQLPKVEMHDMVMDYFV